MESRLYSIRGWDFGFQSRDFGWGSLSLRGRADRRKRLSHRSSCRLGRRDRLLRRLDWLAGSLQTLQLPLRSGIRSLQPALGLPEPVEHGELIFGGLGILEDIYLDHLHAGQFPLRYSHLFHIE